MTQTSTAAKPLTANRISALVRDAIGAGNAKVSTRDQNADGTVVLSVRVMVHAAKAPGANCDDLGAYAARELADAGYTVAGTGAVFSVSLPA